VGKDWVSVDEVKWMQGLEYIEGRSRVGGELGLKRNELRLLEVSGIKSDEMEKKGNVTPCLFPKEWWQLGAQDGTTTNALTTCCFPARLIPDIIKRSLLMHTGCQSNGSQMRLVAHS
jgi:hypothetical protein